MEKFEYIIKEERSAPTIEKAQKIRALLENFGMICTKDQFEIVFFRLPDNAFRVETVVHMYYTEGFIIIWVKSPEPPGVPEMWKKEVIVFRHRSPQDVFHEFVWFIRRAIIEALYWQ